MDLDDLEMIRSEALPEILMHAVVMHCRVKEKRVVLLNSFVRRF